MAFETPLTTTDPKSLVEVEFQESEKKAFGRRKDKRYRVRGPFLLVRALLADIKGETEEKSDEGKLASGKD